MASLSNYLENKLVDELFRGIDYTPPATLYFSLYTAAPTDADTGTEVTGGNYARVAVTPNSTNFSNTQNSGTGASTGTGGQTTNLTAITFPAPTGANWGVITHFGVRDASSGGNLLIHGALTTPKTVNDGDSAPVFSASAFTFTLA